METLPKCIRNLIYIRLQQEDIKRLSQAFVISKKFNILKPDFINIIFANNMQYYYAIYDPENPKLIKNNVISYIQKKYVIYKNYIGITNDVGIANILHLYLEKVRVKEKNFSEKILCKDIIDIAKLKDDYYLYKIAKYIYIRYGMSANNITIDNYLKFFPLEIIISKYINHVSLCFLNLLKYSRHDLLQYLYKKDPRYKSLVYESGKDELLYLYDGTEINEKYKTYIIKLLENNYIVHSDSLYKFISKYPRCVKLCELNDTNAKLLLPINDEIITEHFYPKYFIPNYTTQIFPINDIRYIKQFFKAELYKEIYTLRNKYGICVDYIDHKFYKLKLYQYVNIKYLIKCDNLEQFLIYKNNLYLPDLILYAYSVNAYNIFCYLSEDMKQQMINKKN